MTRGGRLAGLLGLVAAAVLFGWWLLDDDDAGWGDAAVVVTSVSRAETVPVELPAPDTDEPAPILSAHPDSGGRAPPVLHGNVLDGGQAMRAGSVLLREADTPKVTTATWRKNASVHAGGYRIELPHAGRYTAIAYSQDGTRLSGLEVFDAKWGEDVRLDLAVGATRIVGRVVDARTGEPVTDARVSLQAAEASVDQTTLMTADVEADGRFLFDGIGVGDYVVWAWDQDHLSRSSGAFAVTAPGTHDLGELALPHTPELRVIARDAGSVVRTERLVIHLVDEARTEVLQTFRVMGAGRWRLRLIEPGRYGVMALAGAEADAEAWMPGAYELADVELFAGEATEVLLRIQQPNDPEAAANQPPWR